MSNQQPPDENRAVKIEMQLEPNVRLSTKAFDQFIDLFDRFVFAEAGKAIQQHMFWARFQNGEPVSIRHFQFVGANLQEKITELKLPCQINLRDE